MKFSSGDPQRGRLREVQAPALAPDLYISAPKRCLRRRNRARCDGVRQVPLDTLCLVVSQGPTMNVGRSKLSGKL